MNYDELPEWTLPFFDNFTGPYWSDGKFQGSTSKSKKKPTTKLDYLSREHDRSYALCESLECLDDADWDYYVRSREMSLGPRIIGTLPLLGNAPLRSVYKLFGAGYTGVDVKEKNNKMVSKNVEYYMKLSPADKRKYVIYLTAKEKAEYEHIKRLKEDEEKAAAEKKAEVEKAQAEVKKFFEAIKSDKPKDEPKEPVKPGPQTEKPKEPDMPVVPPPIVPEPPKTPVVPTLPDVGNTPVVVDRRDQKASTESSQYNPYALDLSKLRGRPFRNPWFNGPGSGYVIRAKKPKKKKNRIYVAF